jgi:hypothetical protein
MEEALDPTVKDRIMEEVTTTSLPDLPGVAVLCAATCMIVATAVSRETHPSMTEIAGPLRPSMRSHGLSSVATDASAATGILKDIRIPLLNHSLEGTLWNPMRNAKGFEIEDAEAISLVRYRSYKDQS